MRYKSVLPLGLVLFFLMSLCACSSPAPQDKTQMKAPISDQSKFTWQIKVISADTAGALNTMAGIGQYDGSVKDKSYDDAPSNGNEFLIVTLNINKAQVGGNKFVWENLSVKDNNKKAYHRMEDDTFLARHEYSRLAGTDLTLGESEGSVCFEIPAGKTVSDYMLVYNAGDEGENTIPLS